MQEELFDHPIYSAIIRSKTFERLKGISFLGAIDYITDKHKRDNRYRHSLSVGALALLYSRLRNLSRIDQDHLVAAALLHDIGHGPLSHSMEPVFTAKFGLSHHISTSRIITGKSPEGQEIPGLLKKLKLDRERILSLIQGSAEDKAGFALSNPINLDTADAIIRTSRYTNIGAQKDPKVQTGFQPVHVVKALVDKDHAVLDEFWKLKDTVYNNFIHSKVNLFADYLTADYARNNQAIKDKDFFLTDQEFAKKYSLSFKRMMDLQSQSITNKEIRFNKRSYQVVQAKKLSDDSSFLVKYKCTKKPRTVTISQKNDLPLLSNHQH